MFDLPFSSYIIHINHHLFVLCSVGSRYTGRLRWVDHHASIYFSNSAQILICMIYKQKILSITPSNLHIQVRQKFNSTKPERCSKIVISCQEYKNTECLKIDRLGVVRPQNCKCYTYSSTYTYTQCAIAQDVPDVKPMMQW